MWIMLFLLIRSSYLFIHVTQLHYEPQLVVYRLQSGHSNQKVTGLIPPEHLHTTRDAMINSHLNIH